jgi:putative membrane protein (TIGR04086 family)
MQVSEKNPMKAAFFYGIFGFVICLAAFLVISALIYTGRLAENTAFHPGYAAAALGAFIPSYASSKKASKSKLLCGMFSGLVFWGLLMVMGILMANEAVAASKCAVIAGVVFAFAAAGGIFGTMKKQRKRKNRRIP